MWTIDQENVRDLTFQEMTPDEVLYDFDGPRIFTFKVGAELYFACWSDEDSREMRTRYLVVLTTTGEIEHLKRGAISLDRMLNKRFLWCVDRNFNNEVVKATCLTQGISSVPDGFKPEKGTLLWDHLEPEEKPDSMEKYMVTAVDAVVRTMVEPYTPKNQSSITQRRAKLKDQFFQIVAFHLDNHSHHHIPAQPSLFVNKDAAAYLIGKPVTSATRNNAQQARDYSRLMDQNAIRLPH